jgi:microcystin-dependent protein
MYSIYQLQAILDKAEVWLSNNWVKQLERDDRNLKLRCYDIFQLKSGLEWYLSGASDVTTNFIQQSFRVLNSYITPTGDYDVAIIDGYVPITDPSLNSLYIIDNNFDFLRGPKGNDGADGQSAYQLWLSQGNTGTLTDFLASLKGAKGDPGIGTNGLSAYQVWLANGNTGSQADFLSSLIGKDGQSAYQVWLANGHAGTEADFLNAIMGAQGYSAYQVWLNNGNTGTVTDFFNSLKGPKGDPGQSPVSVIISMASAQVPAGYLYCNGQAVSRSVYATLFAAIGVTYGSGDGSTTFNIPDYRGEFLRGFDDGRGFDTGRQFGQHQDDALQDHTHTIPGSANNTPHTSGPAALSFPYQHDSDVPESGPVADAGSGGTVRVAVETRVKNMPVYYYIKY